MGLDYIGTALSKPCRHGLCFSLCLTCKPDELILPRVVLSEPREANCKSLGVCVFRVSRCLAALSNHWPSECLLSTLALWLRVLSSLQSPSCHSSVCSIIAGHSARLYVWVLPLFLLLSCVDRCSSLLCPAGVISVHRSQFLFIPASGLFLPLFCVGCGLLSFHGLGVLNSVYSQGCFVQACAIVSCQS